MQKKIIALAIAAAVSAPAFADNANVTVYGKAILTLDAVSNDKATATKTSAMAINTNASRFGVKGSEDLGGGLKAVYKYELEMDASGKTGAGLGKTRNSGLGLQGGFGKVVMGIWDSPFKVTHNKVELFDNTTVYSAGNLIGHANGKKYATRQKQMIQYWTPKGPLSAAVSFHADPAPTATTDKSILSASATYNDSGLYVAVGYESRADESAAGKTNTGLRLVGRYDFSGAWIGLTQENYTVNDLTQSNSELTGSVKLGSNTLAASYAVAGDVNSAKVGANQVSLRYGMTMSKRSEIFLAYTALKNDTNGTYGLFGKDAGSTQSAFGLGMIHKF